MRLEEIRVYNLALDLAEKVWESVSKWNYFAKDTIGKQLIRAADSVAANISEGYGRYYYKENKQFCYYSRGSLYETKTWLEKAHNRNLIEDETFSVFLKDIETIGIKLNNYINSIGNKPTTNDAVGQMTQ
ncbi:four helix bundle protein [candidate division KSB1 bacterium]|nr:four helix bundle protein [candidate division KSB1 bacterium]